MTRIQKLRFFQITLLIIGILIIYLTYYQKKETADQQLVPKEIQEKIKEQLANQPEGYDVFSDIEYSGLDLSGNRYILKSKQAFNETEDQEVVNLISVEATFYFKDLSIALGQTDRIPLILSVWAPIIILSLIMIVGVLQINEK